ncbi:MAG TPA: hypothetical protein VE225_07130, partial [Rubrobacteraceae bacterium]|nr:hypothetical protein [Rubrobacteraceae bacterium]
FAGRPLLLAPLVLPGVLLLYALFATNRSFRYRRGAVLVATALSLGSGTVSLLLDFDLLGLLGVLFATASGAAGGFVGGFGYARAGGDEMIPPGATIRRREIRRKSS